MPQPRPQPKVRSRVALASFLRKGAGKHGGTAKQRNRRERRDSKINLRKEYT